MFTIKVCKKRLIALHGFPFILYHEMEVACSLFAVGDAEGILASILSLLVKTYQNVLFFVLPALRSLLMGLLRCKGISKEICEEISFPSFFFSEKC